MHSQYQKVVMKSTHFWLPSARSGLENISFTTVDRLARQLPEYETVRAMYGVGERTAPQLMAEIGDVRR